MSTIDISEVYSKIGQMLEAVERGESLAITRDGKAIAVLEPAPHQAQHALPSMAEFRESLKVKKSCSINSVVELRDQERF